MRSSKKIDAAGRRRAAVWTAALASAAALGLAGCMHAGTATLGACQAPAPQAQASSSEAAGGEVSVDFIARTRSDKPICNLQRSQLAVLDDGTQVQLSSLRLVQPTAGAQHLVTLLFDRLGRGTAGPARKMAEKLLSVIPGEGYSIAVMQVNGRLRLLRGYTQDISRVSSGVAEATPTAPAAPTAALTPAEKRLIAAVHSYAVNVSLTERAEGKAILSALTQSQRLVEEHHGYPSLAALQALVLGDRLLPGRKFIFYFSGGMASNSDTREMLHSIVGLANRAGVTIFIVDTSPINTPMSSEMQASMVSSILASGNNIGGINGFGMGAGGGANPQSILSTVSTANAENFEFGSMSDNESPLATLALGTGGVYMSAAGSGGRQMRRIHEDLTSWYEAAWVSPVKRYNGQFRPIEVHSLQKGVMVRARSGYFAVPPSASSGTLPFEVPLLNILAGGALPSAVRYQAGVLRLGELPEGNSAELVVQVPVSQLTLHEDATTQLGTVDAAMVAVIKDSRGRVLQRFGEDFPLHESTDNFRRDAGQTITLERDFSADPGVYTLETAVMDRLGKKVGAQRREFTIEAQPRGPGLSDIALVEKVEPAEENIESDQPMRYFGGQVIPSLDRVVGGETRVVSLFFLLDPVGGSAGQPGLQMQIFRDGQMLTEMPMGLRKVSGTGAAIPYLATIRGNGFQAGEYEVKALFSQNGSTVARSVRFRVEGSGAGAAATKPSALSAAGTASTEAAESRRMREAATSNSRFAIREVTNPLPRPSQAEIDAMIEGARQRAEVWSSSLQNFFCYEVTNHLEDATGAGDWKVKGTLVELMKEVNHAESRTTVMLDGQRSSVKPDRLKFFHSAGEFGAMFHVIFDRSAKTTFIWKRTAFLDGQPVQEFAFRVARANSGFNLIDHDGHTAAVGFEGLFYLDPATGGIRRITVVIDDIPRQLHIRACSMSVDYSWITMENHDFLLPMRGAVSLQEAGRRPVLNEFEFRDYHRYGAQVRVLSESELKALAKE